MSKRRCLAAVFALALLSLPPSVGAAQATRPITVEWENAPLGKVISAFELLSGRTIILPPDASDLRVTAALQNVDWLAALDFILSMHGLVARADASGVIRIEKHNPAPARREP